MITEQEYNEYRKARNFVSDVDDRIISRGCFIIAELNRLYAQEFNAKYSWAAEYMEECSFEGNEVEISGWNCRHEEKETFSFPVEALWSVTAMKAFIDKIVQERRDLIAKERAEKERKELEAQQAKLRKTVVMEPDEYAKYEQWKNNQTN